MKKIIALSIYTICTLANGQDDCRNYPYAGGKIDVLDVQGGTKIIATGDATVSHDDIDSIKDARDEATLEAKALISKFLTEGIKSDENIKKTVNESKTMSGDSRQATRNELIERVKILKNSSSSLLRGVVPLGECYTKAREIRVTVGIKPETIKSAGSIAGGISSSIANRPTPPSNSVATTENINSSGTNNQKLRGAEGYVNTDLLKKF